MTGHQVRIKPDTYVDSVLLMSATRRMRETPGVEWASAVMGTESNVESLTSEGFDRSQLSRVKANDLVLAARAGADDQAEDAMDAGESALNERAPTGEGPRERRPRTLEGAADSMRDAGVALVSVPGAYAALEAHKALSRGLHVLLFSDNVTLADEVELKQRAQDLALFMMGPGAGTAMLGGVGLGFANSVARGPVGIVAAAGTGAQEIMTLLDRWGAGVSHVIGVGGRDLTKDVGGRMARSALRALEADAGTEVIVLVSKPPSPEVAASLLGELGDKPTVVTLIGLEEPPALPKGVRAARTMEQASAMALEALGMSPPDVGRGLAPRVASAAGRLDDGRGAVRGLFSGGTLCSESMVVMAPRLGSIHSNVPLRAEWGLPAPDGAHLCLDLGEEEFTKGRPHPMIDPEPRAEQVGEQGKDPATAVILLDVVLGHGAHADPASILAPACEEVTRRDGGPAVVAYVAGTDQDLQDRGAQCRLLEEAGALLAPTGARAALMAAAVAVRQPEVAAGAP